MALHHELEEAYRSHLITERNLSDNSIRAYLADLESLLQHINQLGITEFSQLELNPSVLGSQTSRLKEQLVPP